MTINTPEGQVTYHMFWDRVQDGSVARIVTHTGSYVEFFTDSDDTRGEELGLLVANIYEHLQNMAAMYAESEQELFDQSFEKIAAEFES